VTLVDSSIWVGHLSRRNRALAALLDDGEVVTHPFVIGEIALGTSGHRDEVLDLLLELPAVPVVTHGEVLSLVERRRLMGTGVGWLDAHLLASALLEGVDLWTADRRLRAVARRAGVAWDPSDAS